MFFVVSTTLKDRTVREFVVSIEDIACVANNPKGTAIITLVSSEFPIWTNETFEEVQGLMDAAGADIKKLKKE